MSDTVKNETSNCCYQGNEKVGDALGKEGCRKVIPIYPVRYAVMPSKESGYSYPTANDGKNAATFNLQMFPELESTSYCLRNLRQNGYVYIYDRESPIYEQWSCYYYHLGKRGLGFYKVHLHSSTKELFYISEAKKNTETTACASKFYPYIPIKIDHHKPKIVYMGYSQVPYTAKIISEVENGSLKTKIMQGIDLGAWIEASDKKWELEKKVLRKAPPVPHTTLPTDLFGWNIDFNSEQQQSNSSFVGCTISNSWSEEVDDNTLQLNAIISDMFSANKSIQCAVALYDGIGMASELSHLVGFAVSEFERFNKDDMQKKWVSDTIESLIEDKGEAAHRYSLSLSPTARAKARTESDSRAADRVKTLTIEYYFKKCRNKERLQYLKERNKVRDDCFEEIKLAGRSHLIWLKYDGVGSLHHAFAVYDFSNTDSFIGFRGAFARCIDALVATDEGVKYACSFLPASGPLGWFYYALKGHESIRNYIAKSRELAKLSEELAEKVGKLVIELDEELEGIDGLLDLLKEDSPTDLVFELSSAIASITSADDIFAALVDEKPLTKLNDIEKLRKKLRNKLRAELIAAKKLGAQLRLDVHINHMDNITTSLAVKLETLYELNRTRLNILEKEMQKLPSDNASRSVSLLTASFIAQGKEFRNYAQLMRTDYLRIFEALERKLIIVNAMELGKLPASIRKSLIEKTDKASRQPSKREFKRVLNKMLKNKRFPGKRRKARAKMKAYKKKILHNIYVTKSPNIDSAYQETPQESLKERQQYLRGMHFWSNVKIGLSGIAILATSNALIDGLMQFNDKNADLYLNSLSAINGSFGIASSSTAIRQFQLEYRAELATTAGKRKHLVHRAAKMERLSLATLAGAAAMASLKNMVRGNRAGKTGETTIQNLYYFAGGLQFSAATLATGQAIAKLENTFVQKNKEKAAKQIAKKMSTEFVKKINVYITLAVFIFETTAYLIEKTIAKLEAQEVGIWIESSIWGAQPKWKNDFKAEQYALKKLFLSPVVTTDFNQVKTLLGPTMDLLNRFNRDYKPAPTYSEQVTIYLPAYHPCFSRYEIKKRGKNITMQGKFNGNECDEEKESVTKTAIITYDHLNWFGDLEIKYWPNVQVAPDIFYTYP